jgi:hypothetical protein
MKKLIYLILLTGTVINAQPGKFAGSKKHLIDVSFLDNDLDHKLKGWTYRGGTSLNDSVGRSGFEISIILYQKAKSQLAVLTGRETNSTRSIIYDVIETTNIPKNYDLNVATCRKNKKNNIEIIALVKMTNTNYFSQIHKAWRCNRDKMRFEFLDKKGVDCLNEGQD